MFPATDIKNFKTLSNSKIQLPKIIFGTSALGNLYAELPEKTKIKIMSIVGGAIFPSIMANFADITHSMSIGFLIPIPFFGYILYYAVAGHKVIKN